MEAREQQTGRGGKSGRIQSYSNLNGCDDDDGDFDDDTYRMSKMSSMMMTILMTLEPSKEPSLCLLTLLTAVDVLSNQLHRVFKEWCPLLLVATTVKKEELHQDLQQNNPRLDLCLVHCHTSLTTGMTFVHRKEQAFKYIC